jgi:hypothetical protein
VKFQEKISNFIPKQNSPTMLKTLLAYIAMCGCLHYTIAQSPDSEHFPKQQITAEKLPAKHNLYVYLLAGQSNMAGRGTVQPADTLPNARIWTLNQHMQIVQAKEPLHFYEPSRTGLGSGLAFARSILSSLPDSARILLIPTAVGGSSIQQWLADSTYRDVALLSNFTKRVQYAIKIGSIKALLWHQGESNANTKTDIKQHSQRLQLLAEKFRHIAQTPNMPILVGELGSFSESPKSWAAINKQLRKFARRDGHSTVIHTADLAHKGDRIHFDSAGQRSLGQRFATAYIQKFNP